MIISQTFSPFLQLIFSFTISNYSPNLPIVVFISLFLNSYPAFSWNVFLYWARNRLHVVVDPTSQISMYIVASSYASWFVVLSLGWNTSFVARALCYWARPVVLSIMVCQLVLFESPTCFQRRTIPAFVERRNSISDHSNWQVQYWQLLDCSVVEYWGLRHCKDCLGLMTEIRFQAR